MMWISVEDRLPNKDTIVIVMDVYGYVTSAKHTGLWWVEAYFGAPDYDVKYWMELPSAPEGDLP